MKITFTFTKPGSITFEVPADTAWSVSGEEVHSTTSVPDVDRTAKVYDAALRLVQARTDTAALRVLRDVFSDAAVLGYTREGIADKLRAQGVNGDEFIGLFVTAGGTVAAANAIFSAMDISLKARGQA